MMAELGPAAPPVTISEAQAYVRIETGEEEALVAGLIRTASAVCETFLGQLVMARDFTQDLPAQASWQRLAVAPVRGIAAVEQLFANGDTAPLPASAYAVDIDASGDGWVRVTQPVPGGRIRVSGSAGLAQEQNAVPEPIRQGVLRLVAHLFASRDGDGGAPPAAVTALWRPYRRTRLS